MCVCVCMLPTWCRVSVSDCVCLPVSVITGLWSGVYGVSTVQRVEVLLGQYTRRNIPHWTWESGWVVSTTVIDRFRVTCRGPGPEHPTVLSVEVRDL